MQIPDQIRRSFTPGNHANQPKKGGREGGVEGGRRAYLGIDEDGVLVGGLVEEEVEAGLELLCFLLNQREEENGKKGSVFMFQQNRVVTSINKNERS
jgi:hypothetical protein